MPHRHRRVKICARYKMPVRCNAHTHCITAHLRVPPTCSASSAVTGCVVLPLHVVNGDDSATLPHHAAKFGVLTSAVLIMTVSGTVQWRRMLKYLRTCSLDLPYQCKRLMGTVLTSLNGGWWKTIRRDMPKACTLSTSKSRILSLRGGP